MDKEQAAERIIEAVYKASVVLDEIKAISKEMEENGMKSMHGLDGLYVSDYEVFMIVERRLNSLTFKHATTYQTNSGRHIVCEYNGVQVWSVMELPTKEDK